MPQQLYWEDIQEGTTIPPLVKHPTTRQLVMWAGASGDLYEVHYDKDFARSKGFTDVLVHGRLKASFLSQMVTDWIGEQGDFRKLTCSYRGLDYTDRDISCLGKVTKKYIEGGQHLAELEIWTENQQGERTTLGTAVVQLPLRR